MKHFCTARDKAKPDQLGILCRLALLLATSEDPKVANPDEAFGGHLPQRPLANLLEHRMCRRLTQPGFVLAHIG